MGKGARYERKLVGLFADADWFVVRSPASGAATNNQLPDLLAAKDGHALIMELKFSSSNNIYLDAAEVEAIEWCAEKMGGHAYVVGRWKQDTTFYGFAPHQCGRTDAGKYAISHDAAQQDAIPLPPQATA